MGGYALRLANGSDERVVLSSPEPEELTASRDLEDVPIDLVETVVPGLIGMIQVPGGEHIRSPLLDQLVAELRDRGQMCQQMVLTLECDDGTVEEARVQLQEPTCREDELRRALQRLWRELGRRNRGLSTASITLGDLCCERGKVIRLFREGRERAVAERTSSRATAMDFPVLAADSQIARAVRHVQAKLGSSCLKRAVPVDESSRLPERRFALVARA